MFGRGILLCEQHLQQGLHNKTDHSHQTHFVQIKASILLLLKTVLHNTFLVWAALTNSARRYDSAVCCSKMSHDAFLSEALYEADKALEKFATALRECACLRDGGWSRW